MQQKKIFFTCYEIFYDKNELAISWNFTNNKQCIDKKNNTKKLKSLHTNLNNNL